MKNKDSLNPDDMDYSRVCNQCGATPLFGWESWQCPSYPFGSCDGKLVPRNPPLLVCKESETITVRLQAAVQKELEEEQIKKIFPLTQTTDIKPCPCCGQDRPYPTRPGKWEYKQHYDNWIKCEIKISDGTEFSDAEKGCLLFYPEYCKADLEDAQRHCEDDEEREDLKKQWDGPQPWPDQAMWRKIQ